MTMSARPSPSRSPAAATWRGLTLWPPAAIDVPGRDAVGAAAEEDDGVVEVTRMSA